MGKRGIVLVFSLLAVLVLTVLMTSFFFKSTNGALLAKKYVEGIRAFWVAEAGIAEGIRSVPSSPAPACVGGSNYCFQTNTTHLSGEYYRIDSIGRVSLPSGGVITKSLSAVIDSEIKFDFAIQSTVDLVIKGNVDIDSQLGNAPVNFPDFFGCTKEEMKSAATHIYTDPANNITPVDGVTWVQFSPEETDKQLDITSNTWSGSGILIVEGDVMITGGTFNGVIYVIGELRMSGNPVIHGAVIAESNTELVEDTTITGRVTIHYDPYIIRDALNGSPSLPPKIVSWWES